MRRLILVAVVGLVAGCAGLRFAPSESIQQNAAINAAATARWRTMADTDAERELADIASLSSLAAQAYIGLPDDLAYLEIVNRLTSDDLDERAAATAAAEQVAGQAGLEGARRPDAQTAVDAGDILADFALDTALDLAPLFGLAGVGATIEALRRAKNRWRDVATTTISNAESLRDRMPPEFYLKQSADLSLPLKAMVKASGGTGAPKTDS